MRKWGWLAAIALLALAACEPLAPPVDSQAIVVITNTPTAVVLPSATPLLSTPLPTAIPPTPTLSPTDTVLAPISTAIPTEVGAGDDLSPLPPCDATEGLSFDSSFESVLTGEPVRYRIYLPPCFYEYGRRYPYVILLHGSSYNYTQWDEDVGTIEVLEAALQEKSSDIAPMVLVLPDGGFAQELNTYNNGALWENVILTEMIPALESTFCLWNEPDGRALGGISRGGFWSMSVGLRNPELFISIGGHSPSFFDDNAPPEYNPLDLASSVSVPLPVRIYLDIARADSATPNFSRFSGILASRDIPHTVAVSPTGDHNNAYWGSQVENYLRFYSEPWPTDPAALPSCF